MDEAFCFYIIKRPERGKRDHAGPLNPIRPLVGPLSKAHDCERGQEYEPERPDQGKDDRHDHPVAETAEDVAHLVPLQVGIALAAQEPHCCSSAAAREEQSYGDYVGDGDEGHGSGLASSADEEEEEKRQDCVGTSNSICHHEEPVRQYSYL